MEISVGDIVTVQHYSPEIYEGTIKEVNDKYVTVLWHRNGTQGTIEYQYTRASFLSSFIINHSPAMTVEEKVLAKIKKLDKAFEEKQMKKRVAKDLASSTVNSSNIVYSAPTTTINCGSVNIAWVSSEF